jgi:uncharacterized membrane protein YhaH (DUF805 family)
MGVLVDDIGWSGIWALALGIFVIGTLISLYIIIHHGDKLLAWYRESGNVNNFGSVYDSGPEP